MKFNELRSGDRFGSLKIPGEGICISHKIYQNEIEELAILWGKHFEIIDRFHFCWNSDCVLISSNNDVSQYQKIFKIKDYNG